MSKVSSSALEASRRLGGLKAAILLAVGLALYFGGPAVMR